MLPWRLDAIFSPATITLEFHKGLLEAQPKPHPTNKSSKKLLIKRFLFSKWRETLGYLAAKRAKVEG